MTTGCIIVINQKITQISFKDSQNIDLLKFSKPKIKLLKDNKFIYFENFFTIQANTSSE